MPIFFQQEIDADTRLAVWTIEENEGFFLQKAVPQRLVSHPHKRLQHLAGRYLLRYLFAGFPVELIQIADTRKPFLEDEAFHFSISHCGDFAAAIVSKTKRVGVDIELIRETVAKVQHKFVTEEEFAICDLQFGKENDEWATNGQLAMGKSIIARSRFQLSESQVPGSCLKLLTLLWSCKEAVYKWYGWGEVDFKEHIAVQNIKQMAEPDYETTICFQKSEPVMLELKSRCFDELVLSYVVS